MIPPDVTRPEERSLLRAAEAFEDLVVGEGAADQPWAFRAGSAGNDVRFASSIYQNPAVPRDGPAFRYNLRVSRKTL
jgi:hypothetical protein